MTRSRAKIGWYLWLNKSIQTRKISSQKCTEICFARSVLSFYERNTLRLICACLNTVIQTLGMLLDLVCCLRFSQVSQHPACLDHSIQTREYIWYFLNISVDSAHLSMASAKPGDWRPDLRIFISFFFGLFAPVRSCLQYLNTEANKWTFIWVNTNTRTKWLLLKKVSAGTFPLV